METYTSEMVIDRPRQEVYDRLRRFEDYPRFMDSAEEVERLDGDRLRWKASFGPVTREYESKITEERENERIAWRTDEEDVKEEGEFTLTDAVDGGTLVRMDASYDLDSVLLKGIDAVGVLERKAEKDLERLKRYLEQPDATTS